MEKNSANIKFDKIAECPLDEWYEENRGTGDLDELASYLVTHQCYKNDDYILVQRKTDGQKYFAKVSNGGELMENEYRAHDILDPLKCPHIIKLEERIVVDLYYEGVFMTKIYNQFDRKILRPHTKVIMRQLFKALSVMHANNVVHMDIKPYNIVWEWKDNVPHIYVIDFGLSYPLDHENIRYYSMTKGTNAYMAPERYEDSYRNVPNDVRTTDIWSAGVVFAELLLDSFLFDRISKNILDEFVQNIVAHFAGVDPLAVDLLKHLLTHHSQRYTAEQALQHPYLVELDTNDHEPTSVNKTDAITGLDELRIVVASSIGPRIESLL